MVDYSKRFTCSVKDHNSGALTGWLVDQRHHLSPPGPCAVIATKSWASCRQCDWLLVCDNTPRLVLTTNMATNSIKLLTGNSYPELARLVADRYVLSLHEPSNAAGLRAQNNTRTDFAVPGRLHPGFFPSCTTFAISFATTLGYQILVFSFDQTPQAKKATNQ